MVGYEGIRGGGRTSCVVHVLQEEATEEDECLRHCGRARQLLCNFFRTKYEVRLIRDGTRSAEMCGYCSLLRCSWE